MKKIITLVVFVFAQIAFGADNGAKKDISARSGNAFAASAAMAASAAAAAAAPLVEPMSRSSSSSTAATPSMQQRCFASIANSFCADWQPSGNVCRDCCELAGGCVDGIAMLPCICCLPPIEKPNK